MSLGCGGGIELLLRRIPRFGRPGGNFWMAYVDSGVNSNHSRNHLEYQQNKQHTSNYINRINIPSILITILGFLATMTKVQKIGSVRRGDRRPFPLRAQGRSWRWSTRRCAARRLLCGSKVAQMVEELGRKPRDFHEIFLQDRLKQG